MEEKRVKNMVQIFAEETNESEVDVRRLYENDVIVFFEDGESLAHFLASEEMKGTLRVVNLYDWGWALDMRERC